LNDPSAPRPACRLLAPVALAFVGAPAEFRAVLRADIKRWAQIARQAGIERQ
jgi:tripartite-type tricarboxylate transporter receptor subunit TctC